MVAAIVNCMKTIKVSFKYMLGFAVVAGFTLQPVISKAENEDSAKTSSESQASKASSSDSEGGKNVDTGISPVQAKADPFGLPLTSLVRVAGSDAAAAEFMSYMPDIQKWINKNLPEQTLLKNAGAMVLDPAKLSVLTDSTARIYFVGEGAGYHNTLGLNVLPPGTEVPTAKTAAIMKGVAELLFPDASSTVSTYVPAKVAQRTATDPLLPGDFVDLGNVKAGTLLDFFLISNGATGGSNIFTDEALRNSDRIQHMVTLALPNSPYLLMSFEDMYGGGDRDFNDTIFALDLSSIKLQRLVSAPEPSTWLIMAGFGVVLLLQNRRSINA